MKFSSILRKIMNKNSCFRKKGKVEINTLCSLNAFPKQPQKQQQPEPSDASAMGWRWVSPVVAAGVGLASSVAFW